MCRKYCFLMCKFVENCFLMCKFIENWFLMCKFVENCFLMRKKLFFSCLNLYLKKKRCRHTLSDYTTTNVLQ